MPIIDLQRSLRELGRLRMGKVEKPARGKPRPVKLTTWRLTTPWRHLLDAALELGIAGEVVPWHNPGTDRDEFELITDTATLDVIVPPGEQVLSQWWELWSGGGAIRRCDGVTMTLDAGKTAAKPCRCPADPAERQEGAAANPPTACKPTTRLNVMLPGLPDLGVWRLESHGFYAAVELAGAATIAETAARRGMLLPAELRIEPRRVKRHGEQVKRFAVPVLALRGRLGETLDALGMRDGDRPVAIGAGARPALDAGGTPALPAAPGDFASPPPVGPAELATIDGDDEPDAFVPPEPEPDTRVESTSMPPAQLLAMRSREVGLDDTARRRLYEAVTGKTSGKDLDAGEVRAVLFILDGIREGHVRADVTRDGAAFVVYDRRAKRTLHRLELGEDEADAFAGLDDDLSHQGEPIRDRTAPPSPAVDDEVAEGELVDDGQDDAPEAGELIDEDDYADLLEPVDADAVTGPAAQVERPADTAGWRSLLRSRGVRVIDALRHLGIASLDELDDDAGDRLITWLEEHTA